MSLPFSLFLSLFSPRQLSSSLSNPLSLSLSPFFIPITTFHTRPCPIPSSTPLFISLYLRSFVDTRVLPSAGIAVSLEFCHSTPSHSSLHPSFFPLSIHLLVSRRCFRRVASLFCFPRGSPRGVNDRRGAIARCCVECRITSGRGAINARIMFNIARLSGLAT